MVGLCFATNALPSLPLLAVCGVFEVLFTNFSMLSKHGYETVVLLQAIEEHAEVLKARDAMIAALQSSLSAKDMELQVGSFFRLQLCFIRSFPLNARNARIPISHCESFLLGSGIIGEGGGGSEKK